jgi:hypothetical protein
VTRKGRYGLTTPDWIPERTHLAGQDLGAPFPRIAEALNVYLPLMIGAVTVFRLLNRPGKHMPEKIRVTFEVL